MSDDLYQPPKADLKITQAPTGSLWRGATYGALTDSIGTLLFGIIFGITYGLVLSAQGMSEGQIMAQLAQIALLSPLGLFTTGIGVLISVYAGYVAAKYAGNSVNSAPVIVCVISCSFGLLMGFSTYSMLENLILLAATAIAILGGAKLWRAKNVTPGAATPRVED